MKKTLIVGLMVMMFATGMGCTNMSRTQQGVASGAALGALGGAGVAPLAGRRAGRAAEEGGRGAAWAGGYVGHQQDKNYRW